MKLHLCCGKRNFGTDWVHIDKAQFPYVVHNDVMYLPYPDNAVDLIYCSHGLQYFDREEVVNVLREWYRVLKPGGILRLAVPDFRAIVRLYGDYNNNLEMFLGLLYGKMQMNDQVIYHKTVYDSKSLNELLLSIGFKSTRKWDWRKVEHGCFDDHSQAYLPCVDKEIEILMSLNMEATK